MLSLAIAHLYQVNAVVILFLLNQLKYVLVESKE